MFLVVRQEHRDDATDKDDDLAKSAATREARSQRHDSSLTRQRTSRIPAGCPQVSCPHAPFIARPAAGVPA